MTQQALDFGTASANDGEFLPTAFLKIQQNFSELYAGAWLGNGTAGVPSLAFASDPDTGLYRIGANEIGVAVGGTGTGLGLSATALYPITSDAEALGTSSKMWSDLFLASGGVVNWNNGNYTITHSSGLLTLAGSNSSTSALAPNFQITPPTATINTGLYVFQNGLSGTATGSYDPILNRIYINESINDPYTTLQGFVVAHDFGGASVRGGRNAAAAYLTLGSTTSASNTFRVYTGFLGVSTAGANDNGTDLTTGARGSFYGLSGLGQALAGATFLNNVTGCELNTRLLATSSVRFKSLLQVSGYTDDVVAGGTVNAMFWAYNQSGSSAAWSDGILFDGTNATWPISSGGYLLRTQGGPVVFAIRDDGRIGWASDALSYSAGTLTFSGSLTLQASPLSMTASNAALELGNPVSANTPLIDFHSSGNVVDYDVRLIASGGTASAGNGTLQLAGTSLTPTANDGAALGTTALKWSDLHLASGAVVNFNNGDVTVTHSSNTLSFAGASTEYAFDSNITMTSSVTFSPALSIYNLTNDSGYVACNMFKSRAGSVVQSGDGVGGFGWAAWDGDQYYFLAQILAEVDGTPGNDDMPGRIVFKTTPDGSTTLTTRLTIQQTGILKFESASFQANGGGTVTITNVAPAGVATATITKWLRIDDASGVDSYIPVWQ